MAINMWRINSLTDISPSRWFLIIGLSFGAGLVFLTPPMQVPDEGVHFARAYQISQGDIHGEISNDRRGGNLPRGIVTLITAFISQGIQFHPDRKQDAGFIIAQRKILLEANERTFAEFSSGVFYPPIPYLPAAMSIWIGRQIGFCPLVLFYIGRLFTLGAYLLIVVGAIRLIPIQKHVLMLIAAFPMSLFLAASFSADAVTNGLSFLFIATAFRVALIGDISPWWIVAQAPLIGLSKAYLPLLGLIGLIPAARFTTKSRFYIWIISVVSGGLGALAGWSWWNSDLYWQSDQTYLPALQLTSLLTEPSKFIHIFFKTFGNWGCIKTYIENMIGILGFLDTRLPAWSIIGTAVILFITAFFDANRHAVLLSRRFRLINLFVFVSSIPLVAIWLYVSCNRPADTTFIVGIQGRYFIPVLPCLFAALVLKRSSMINLSILMVVWISILSAVMISTILQRYYGL